MADIWWLVYSSLNRIALSTITILVAPQSYLQIDILQFSSALLIAVAVACLIVTVNFLNRIRPINHSFSAL
jgi:hypothetical protein